MGRRKSIFLLLLVTFTTSSCHAGYMLDQGVDFIGLMNDRVPIEDVRSDPNYPDSVRKKLAYIQHARSFAGNDLGLRVTDQYTTFVPLERNAVSWNITASPWNHVRPLTWSFPLVGSFPYLGFFEKSEALAYRDELVSEGYDVYLRPVSAFSTLGWFSDPVYSPMLDQPESVLVETVIHELLHANVFFHDNVHLSESVASQIGQLATLAYLKKRYGKDASIVSWTKQYHRDLDRVNRFFLDLRDRLQSLYESNLPEDRMKERKKNIFRRAKRDFSNLTDRLKTGGWDHLLSKDWNNAFVSAQAVYSRHTELIKKLWKKHFQKDLRATIKFLNSVSDNPEPVKAIQRKISGGRP